MKITDTAVSLNVEDVAASANFLTTHFGFRQTAADEAGNYAALDRDDAGAQIIFLRRGSVYLPEDFRDQRASGLILAFTVEDLAAEETLLREANANITLPLREESWGERLFQVTGPNGVIIQLVEWAKTV